MKAATSMLILCVASLLALGMVMLYSSSMADKGNPLQMQMIWCSLGVIGCATAMAVDYRRLKKFAWPIFIVAAIMLVVVLIPIPKLCLKINGARRWFALGSHVRFEPSELGKIALIIMVAWYGDRYQRQLGSWKYGLVYPVLLFGAVLGLIFREPDRGTTILMATVSCLMLIIAGARWKFIIPPIVIGVAGLAFSLLFDPMRTKRIFAWLYADEHKMDVGYQANQAMLALGAGGWTGLGLGNSREKLGFLPEHNTDFIFGIIGEELGLVGTLFVLVVFIALIISGIYISANARDRFGLLLGSGITFLIGLQAFINIGVVTSTLPNKGLPLPFISYGGSNLLILLTAIGILISIARHSMVTQTASSTSLEPEGDQLPQPT